MMIKFLVYQLHQKLGLREDVVSKITSCLLTALTDAEEEIRNSVSCYFEEKVLKELGAFERIITVFRSVNLR
jgi:hypothetical protein